MASEYIEREYDRPSEADHDEAQNSIDVVEDFIEAVIAVMEGSSKAKAMLTPAKWEDLIACTKDTLSDGFFDELRSARSTIEDYNTSLPSEYDEHRTY